MVELPEIYFERKDDGYAIKAEYVEQDCFAFVEFVNRDELRAFRDSIHNLLLDLNMELGYE